MINDQPKDMSSYSSLIILRSALASPVSQNYLSVFNNGHLISGEDLNGFES